MATKQPPEDPIIGSVQHEVESLMQGVQIKDPRLYDAILLLNTQIERLTQEVSPLVRKSGQVIGGVSTLPAPGGFTCFSTRTTVRFTWNHVDYAAQYEIRQGNVWETASLLFRTTGLQGDIDPLQYGAYNFLIKTLDSQGNYSATSESTTFTVPFILAPVITVSIIDNNVLLYWTEPPSAFKIDYYWVDKHGDSEAEGRVDGTFTSIFEVVAGDYTYTVRAVDVAGNEGAEAETIVHVNAPPDFALQDSQVSGLNGTRVNVIRMPERPSLLACWTIQDWQGHFLTRSWLDPQDQVSAGYPIYIQPSTINGSYEETIDYGVVIHNTIVTITWNTIIFVPEYNVAVVVKMEVSDDGVIWSGMNAGASQYFAQLRYLRFRLEFTAENDKVFIELYNLTISLNVKRENDGGEIEADKDHVGGTTVTFQKAFRDVESITCTTKSTTEPYVVIFNFVDVPNPTTFTVFVFDTTGNRVTKTVDWKARGIV